MRLPLIASLWSAALLLAPGCDNNPNAVRCTVRVKPTSDATKNHTAIQTALSNAKKNDVVCLEAGTWPVQKELALSTSNVELRGIGATPDATVLDFAGQSKGANGINVIQADAFRIENLTVRNTAGDAVRVTMGTGVIFRQVNVTWAEPNRTQNGAYGLYPVQSKNILIEKCKVSNASDAGIYVGQSQNIIVRDSEAFGNVAGIEIENSTDAEVFGNYAHDNTGGILVFDLPGLTTYGKRTKLHHNRIEKNNGPNFAEPSGAVSIVPSGTGVLVIASDQNEVHDNTIQNNDSLGVAVISYLLAQRKFDDPKYDVFPEGNYIHDNKFLKNGEAPSGQAALIAAAINKTPMPFEDMVWDGAVDAKKMNVDKKLANCFKNNGTATYRYLGVVFDKAGMIADFKDSRDMAAVTCEQALLAPISLP